MYSQAKLLGYEVLKLGHEALRKPSSKIKEDQFGTNDLGQFVEHMVKTIHARDGIGLAAPQVGVNRQIFITEITKKAEERFVYCKSSSLKVWINPSYERVDSGLLSGTEECLSVPNIAGRAMRPKAIRAKALDLNGKETTEDLFGWNARVFLHEYDHLKGKLYIDELCKSPQGYIELYEYNFWKELEEKKRKKKDNNWLEIHGLKPE